METLTVPISPAAHATLRELASSSNETMSAVLDKAIEAYRRQRFLEDLNASYAALRADPEAWAEEQRDRGAWDATLSDGLKAE
jgi:predicted transcriptional regulator